MTEPAHKTLAEALAAFQAEAPKLHKSETANAGSYSYKYVDLADIVEKIKPLMAKHGLSFSSFPCIAPDGKPGLRYVLRHSGGDCESEVMSLMVSKADAQAHGSAISYARRYALTAVLNLVADADDDGKAAKEAQERAERAGNANGSPPPTAAPAQATERVASAKQRGLIFARASEHHMPASVLANVVLVSNGADPRDFAGEEQAEQFLKRAMDRLPASKVDLVLKNLMAEATP